MGLSFFVSHQEATNMVNKIIYGTIVCALIYILILLSLHMSWTRRQTEIREHEIRTWNQADIIEVIYK